MKYVDNNEYNSITYEEATGSRPRRALGPALLCTYRYRTQKSKCKSASQDGNGWNLVERRRAIRAANMDDGGVWTYYSSLGLLAFPYAKADDQRCQNDLIFDVE